MEKVWVPGYVRDDGVRVKGYYRKAPSSLGVLTVASGHSIGVKSKIPSNRKKRFEGGFETVTTKVPVKTLIVKGGIAKEKKVGSRLYQQKYLSYPDGDKVLWSEGYVNPFSKKKKISAQ